MKETVHDFFQQLRESLRSGEFIHLVLSRPTGQVPVSGELPAKISIRPVTLKSGPHLQFASQSGPQERHHNLDWDSACSEVEALFGSSFRHAHLFTSSADIRAQSKGSGHIRITRTKPSRKMPSTQD